MKNRIAIVLITCLLFFSACQPQPSSTATEPIPSMLPFPIGMMMEEAKLYSGPGNIVFDELDNLSSGESVYLLGQYEDFIKIQTIGSSQQGFVYKELLDSDSSTLPVLDAVDVPMETHDLVTENCMGPFTTFDDSGLAIMRSPGLPDGGSFGIHGGITTLTDTTILNLNLETTSSGPGSLWIQDSPSMGEEPEWSHRVLEIKVVDHLYSFRIMDGTGGGGFYDYDLFLPEGELLVVELIGKTAERIRFKDSEGLVLMDLIINSLQYKAGLSATALADGLFPNGSMNITCAVSTPSDLLFFQRDIQTIPDGHWIETTPDTDESLQLLSSKFEIDMMMPMANWLGEPHYFEIYKRDFGFDILTNTSSPWFWDDIGTYNFDFMDQIVAFDKAQGWKMAFILHNEDGNLPTSLYNSSYTREEYIEILHEYVTTVVSHYRDDVSIWIIAPEAVSFYVDRGETTIDFWADRIGMEYIEMMFRWAREADPDGILMWADGVYADTGNERFERQYQTMLSMFEDYMQRGVPIDAIGIGGSFYTADWVSFPFNKESLLKTIRDFSQYDIEIYIPEIEIGLIYMEGTIEERRNAQVQIYRDIMDACIESGVCRGIGIFGVRDMDIDWNCPEGYIDPCPSQPAEPLLFDGDFNPKPAYYAILESLKSH